MIDEALDAPDEVLVTSEHRFLGACDGHVYTSTVFPYSFWRRYLSVFERVCVLARVKDVSRLDGGELRADGDGVRFISLPAYIGPWQYLRVRHRISSVIRHVAGSRRTLVLRCPSILGAMVQQLAASKGRPYAVEVVGDPYDAFASGANGHPLRPAFRWLLTRQLRADCRGATCVAYVTNGSLQARYPARPGAATEIYSSIELSEGAFAHGPRVHGSIGQPRIVTVASLSQPYKGVDVLLKALSLMGADGVDASLTVIGDGCYRRRLELVAETLGLGARVTFTGEVHGAAAVRDRLRHADLFVLASRSEGLPRSMIEAMAQGMPCIGTTAGGTAELLEPGFLAAPDDADALRHRILSLVQNSTLLDAASARNLEKAQEFRDDVLNVRRRRFYSTIRTAAIDYDGRGL